MSAVRTGAYRLAQWAMPVVVIFVLVCGPAFVIGGAIWMVAGWVPTLIVGVVVAAVVLGVVIEDLVASARNDRGAS